MNNRNRRSNAPLSVYIYVSIYHLVDARLRRLTGEYNMSLIYIYTKTPLPRVNRIDVYIQRSI